HVRTGAARRKPRWGVVFSLPVDDLGETRDDEEPGGPAPAGAAERPAAAALLRVGRLDRFHQDEAALIPLDGDAAAETGATEIREIRFTRAAHDDCRREGAALVVESTDPWMSAPHAVIEVRRGAGGTTFRVADAGSRNGVL